VFFKGMRMILTGLVCLPALVMAHTGEHEKARSAGPHGGKTGTGAWIYQAVPGWGDLPNDKQFGPTHGGVVVAPNGNVVLSTDSELSLVIWKPDGTFLRSIAPECQGIHGMQLVTEDGRPVIYGAQNNGAGNKQRVSKGLSPTPFRIVKLDLDGTLLTEIPNKNTADVPGGWNGLTAVAVAADGAVFAAMGYGSQMIHKFDADGRLLKSFGGPGGGEGTFKTCHGLTIDHRFGEPRLLVADRENRRLCHLDLAGNWIGVHAEHLRRPCAMAWFGEVLAVAELEARVTLLDKAGKVLATLGDNPDKTKWANFTVPPTEQEDGIFTAPHGIAFAANGDLYVQDWNASGRITCLRKQ
jgi:hypothetical protein